MTCKHLAGTKCINAEAPTFERHTPPPKPEPRPIGHRQPIGRLAVGPAAVRHLRRIRRNATSPPKPSRMSEPEEGSGT